MKQTHERKSVFISRGGYVISVMFVMIIYFFKAYSSIENLDYVAINGTFQNYNVIRRLLDGQIPFVEYTVYLGSGHLLITSAMTFLFGGSFAASLLAYNYVSSLSIVLLCYGFCSYRFKGNWLIPALLSLYLRLFFTSEILGKIAVGGNSARGIRGLILPICIVLYVAISKWLEKHSKWNEKKQFYTHILLISCMEGISVVWGNDYGIVCCVAMFIMVILLTVVRFKSIIRSIIAFFIMSLGTCVTMFIISSCITRGHPLVWFKKNFGASFYQSWYFNEPEDRGFYFYDIDLSLPVLICSAFMLLYFILLLRNINWENIRKNGLPAFAMLSSLGATEEYKLFSGGGYILHDFLNGTLLILCFVEIIYLISLLIKKLNIEINFSIKLYHEILAICVICCIAVICTIIDLPRKHDGKYIPELGGHLVLCRSDLEKSMEYAGDKKVFSVYASALETVTKQYQPSGTDYIIHCLSDESRQHYLDVFHQRNFDCVSTVHMNYNIYGPWIRNANWFFYREVYENYHFVGHNSYADYWEYGAEPDSCFTGDIQVKIETVSDTSVRIRVAAPDNINGLADVYIDYDSQVKKGKDSFLLHQNIVGLFPSYIKTGRINDWSLQPSGKEYIPIEVRNGKGMILVESFPVKATSLTVNDVKCDRIFMGDALT